jgi:hypothetical protein
VAPAAAVADWRSTDVVGWGFIPFGLGSVTETWKPLVDDAEEVMLVERMASLRGSSTRRDMKSNGPLLFYYRVPLAVLSET